MLFRKFIFLLLCLNTSIAIHAHPSLVLQVKSDHELTQSFTTVAQIDQENLSALREKGTIAFNPHEWMLREYNVDSKSWGETIPFQWVIPSQDSDSARLYFELTPTTSRKQREFHFEKRPDQTSSPQSPHSLSIHYPVWDQSVLATRIDTPNAQWWYDVRGAGFSSITDSQHEDWINFQPGGGSKGEFRGIPNNGFPEGYMHPGKTLSKTEIKTQGSLLVELHSRSLDETWQGTWHIFPERAHFTQEQASHSFWFLYEGTPGGTVEPDLDYWMRSDGITGVLSQSWNQKNSEHTIRWVAFADGKAERSLLFVNHQTATEETSYYLMQEAMTVFGFGRKGLEKYFTATPAHFTVALIETRDPSKIRSFAQLVLNPPKVSVTRKEHLKESQDKGL